MEGWPSCSSSHDQGEPWLPPGFRFHPTDEELVTYYLAKKIQNNDFTDRAIAEADLNKCEPWELPGKAQMGEKEWYFFSLRDRKYPTGMRTNRATDAGYWKATGKDREVISSRHGRLVGMKKTLVFYKGRAPKGEKTNWVMHEYRMESNNEFGGGNNLFMMMPRGAKEEWVVCRIFHKSSGGKHVALADFRRTALRYDSAAATTLPALLESPLAAAAPLPSSCAPLCYPPTADHLASLLAPAPAYLLHSSADTPFNSSLRPPPTSHPHFSCKPEPFNLCSSAMPLPPIFNDNKFPSSTQLPDLPQFARLPIAAELLTSYGHLLTTGTPPPPPSQQQVSLEGMTGGLSQEALSESCGTNATQSILPQLLRFPSDLESLSWVYSDHQPTTRPEY